MRRVVHRLLRADTAEGAHAQGIARDILAAVESIGMRVPAEIGDYTDFYASVFHASNVGVDVPPRQSAAAQLQVDAHRLSRARSSIVASGTPVRRPRGQTVGGPAGLPTMTVSARMDYELEIGAYVARGNRMGDAIPAGAGRGPPVRPLPRERLVGP